MIEYCRIATAIGVLGAAMVTAAAADGHKVLNNIVYARIGDRAMHLNLVMPQDGKLHPAVLWVHGGGWCEGTYMEDLAAAYQLFGKGYVTGSIEYRLSQEAKYPAQIHDCKAAIRFLRANAQKYGIDPNRIGVWGGSAGGHLVALLGTTGGVKELEGTEGKYAGYSSRVQAVCDLFGPTDLTAEGLKGYLPEVVSVADALLGGPAKEKASLARLASPVFFASKDDPPMLIMHGDKDTLVPIKQSEQLYNALKKAGADVKFVKVKNGGHGFGPSDITPSFDELKAMIGEFFRKHLEK